MSVWNRARYHGWSAPCKHSIFTSQGRRRKCQIGAQTKSFLGDWDENVHPRIPDIFDLHPVSLCPLELFLHLHKCLPQTQTPLGFSQTLAQPWSPKPFVNAMWKFLYLLGRDLVHATKTDSNLIPKGAYWEHIWWLAEYSEHSRIRLKVMDQEEMCKSLIRTLAVKGICCNSVVCPCVTIFMILENNWTRLELYPHPNNMSSLTL